MCLSAQNMFVYDIKIQAVVYSKSLAKQKHPGCKKLRGQSEAALQIGMCDQKL